MSDLCCPSSDMVYCGVYDNALDNDNYNEARGFNYHQGPVSETELTSTVGFHLSGLVLAVWNGWRKFLCELCDRKFQWKGGGGGEGGGKHTR